MNSLRGCRGILLGFAISLVMWAGIAGLVYLVWW